MPISTKIVTTGFLLLCLALISCSEDKSQEEEAASQSNTLTANQKTSVFTAKAEKATFYYYINATGRFEAPRDQLLLAETGGRIKRLHIKEGMRVAQGQLLLEIDDAESKLRLKKAEIALQVAQLNFENEMLGSPSLSARTDEGADEIKERIMVSGGIKAAEVDLETAKLELDRHKIRAPYNGIISDLKVSEQEYITASKEICRMYENGFMYLRAKVLENDISMIADQMPVSIKGAAIAESLEGIISSRNPRVDENGMCELKIRVESKQLLPGMSAVAEIKVPKHQTLIVPKDAVVIRSGRPVVFTLVNGIAKWNYVKIGLDNGREVEILEGITEGDVVITTNNLQLAHDAPVEVKRQ